MPEDVRPVPGADRGVAGRPGGVDWRVIEAFEGNRLDGYVPSLGGAPIGNSGVTIGSGIDLGQMDQAALASLDIAEPLKDTLRPYLGLRGAEAQRRLAADPLSIDADDAAALNAALHRARLALLREHYDQAVGGGVAFDDLPEAAQTVIASVAFQWGGIWSVSHKNAYARSFWRAAVARDWRRAEAILRGWADETYPVTVGSDKRVGYRGRRLAEAAHLGALIGAPIDARIGA